MKFLTFLLFSTIFLSANVLIPTAFKANFIQQVKNKKGKIIKYRGVIYFNAPTTTKWIYKSPTKKEVCSRNKQLIVIDHDLEQVNYYSIDKSFNLSKVLHRAKQYKGNIYTTKYKNKLYTIVLNKEGKISQIAYKDDLDNTVNIMFTSIKYRKKPFKNYLLECIRPKSYDTIY